MRPQYVVFGLFFVLFSNNVEASSYFFASERKLFLFVYVFYENSCFVFHINISSVKYTYTCRKSIIGEGRRRIREKEEEKY